MVSAAYVRSLGPAEESPSGLFLPCPPAQLCSSLWQMAEPDLSQVLLCASTWNCAWRLWALRTLPLDLFFLCIVIFSNGLQEQLQQPAMDMGYSIDYPYHYQYSSIKIVITKSRFAYKFLDWAFMFWIHLNLPLVQHQYFQDSWKTEAHLWGLSKVPYHFQTGDVSFTVDLLGEISLSYFVSVKCFHL